MKTDSITLFYRSGTHDKVYVSWLNLPFPDASFCQVCGSWGRRTAWLKDPESLPTKIYISRSSRQAALSEMEILASKKVSKGYTPHEDGHTRLFGGLWSFIVRHPLPHSWVAVSITAEPPDIISPFVQQSMVTVGKAKENVSCAKPARRMRLLEL